MLWGERGLKMADLKIEVFTSPRCPHCPEAVKATKQLLKENKQLADRIRWVEVNTGTRKGNKRAQKYAIRSVPTIVLTNKKGEKAGIRGAPSQKKYLEYVYDMLGEKMMETTTPREKRGLLDRIFGRGG